MSSEPVEGPRASSPSWVWLLLAAGLLVFASLWLAQGDAPEPVAVPSLQNTGRKPIPPGGDFAGVRRDRMIEPREPRLPSALSGERAVAVPPGAEGPAGADAAAAPGPQAPSP